MAYQASSPPFYVLVSPAASANQLHTSLLHPTVQLHYADDPPTALLPTAQNPNILILEPHQSANEGTPRPGEPHLQSSSPPSVALNSTSTLRATGRLSNPPSVHSLTPAAAVTSVRMAQPPAAAVAYAASQGQDPTIYIIDYAPAKPQNTPEDAGWKTLYERRGRPRRCSHSFIRETRSYGAYLMRQIQGILLPNN